MTAPAPETTINPTHELVTNILTVPAGAKGWATPATEHAPVDGAPENENLIREVIKEWPLVFKFDLSSVDEEGVELAQMVNDEGGVMVKANEVKEIA